MKFERIHEEACGVEQVHFKKTKKRVSPRKANPFMELAGRLPVLVSAGHAVRYLRGKELKRSDEFTGSYAYLLSEYTGCHALAVKKLYGGDPNWDADDGCIYKAKLAELVREHSIKLVLDLHGAARERTFDVDLGTMHGESLLGQKVVLDTIKDSLAENGVERVTTDRFAAEKQNTVTRFASQVLGVPAVQLEINHRYRAQKSDAGDYRRLFTALAGAIETLGAAAASW